MKAFVIAESADAQKELCAGARTLADEVLLVSIGRAPQTGVADVAYRIELPEGELVENAYDTVAALYDETNPDAVIFEPTARLKIVGGRLAAHAGTSVMSDITALDGAQAESLYFGGLATKKQQATGERAFYSSNGSAFANAEASGTDVVETRAFVTPERALKLRGTHEVPHVGADLGRASVIVGAGRGFAHVEDLDLARDLASAVHGEIACSRPLAENEKWLPKNLYLGVSGRMVSPKVYFAIGISGQMQHMIGVHNADVIVAINKDQNAPVFSQADFGLVGDLHEALPALVEKLS